MSQVSSSILGKNPSKELKNESSAKISGTQQKPSALKLFPDSPDHDAKDVKSNNQSTKTTPASSSSTQPASGNEAKAKRFKILSKMDFNMFKKAMESEQSLLNDTNVNNLAEAIIFSIEWADKIKLLVEKYGLDLNRKDNSYYTYNNWPSN